MNELKIKVNKDDINAIYDKYDEDGGKSLDYGEFLELLSFDTGKSKKKSKKKGKDAATSDDEEATDRLISKIRRRLEDTLGSESQSRKRIKEVFEEIDRDGSSSIDKRELKKAMEVLGLNLRSAEIDALFERFDESGDGSIDYGEYLELLGFAPSDKKSSKKKSSRSREDDERLDALISKIRRRLEDTLGSESQSRKRIKEVFEEIDRDGSSSIDKREFKKAMEVLGLNLRSAEIDAIFDRFDVSRDGKINYGEYLKLLGFQGNTSPSRPSSRYRLSEID